MLVLCIFSVFVCLHFEVVEFGGFGVLECGSCLSFGVVQFWGVGDFVVLELLSLGEALSQQGAFGILALSGVRQEDLLRRNARDNPAL